MKTIYLKCESDSKAYDQGIRAIHLERETKASWFGKPLSNPNCPTLEWPKFAWVEVVNRPSDLEEWQLTGFAQP